MALRLAHINRMRRITQTLVRHGIMQLLDGATGGIDPARAGKRLAEALDELGPTFIKLGQVLATREDMLPPAFARELAQLQDKATPFGARVARAHIEAALGSPIVARFASFVDEPLAAGSIAQIHRARTLAGDEVVVKVRRPDIDKTIDEDVELLETLADQLVRRFPAAARHDPVGFVREFARGLRAELDFVREADSLARMRSAVGGSAVVPRVHTELSSGTVLTMDFVAGAKVSLMVDPGLRKEAARRLVACFTDQYLRGELFHADPHAGNLLWTGEDKLALLDLGAVGAIDENMRRSLRHMAAAAVSRNERALARALLTMVHTPADLDRHAVERDLGRLVSALLCAPLGDVAVSRLVGDVFALAQRHGLRFKAEYFLLFRSAMLVDGVLRGLDPKIDPVTAARSYILRSIWRPAWMLPAIWLGAYAAARSVGVAATRARDAVKTLPARLRAKPPLRRLAPAVLVLVVGVVIATQVGSGSSQAQPATDVNPLLPPSALAPPLPSTPVRVVAAADAADAPPLPKRAPASKPGAPAEKLEARPTADKLAAKPAAEKPLAAKPAAAKPVPVKPRPGAARVKAVAAKPAAVKPAPAKPSAKPVPPRTKARPRAAAPR